MADVVITGGAGFIGSHLAEGCLRQGHRVRILDDLSSGRIENIASIRTDKNLQFVEGSVLDRALLMDLTEGADIIFHLAATVGVKNVMRSPTRCLSNNICGTETVLKVAASRKLRVVLASTSEVYGPASCSSFSESAATTFGAPEIKRWSYACSKLASEFFAQAYSHEFRVNTVIVRLFNTIGPRQLATYGMVVPRFLNQALEGSELTVYGVGDQTRCFAYVQDVVNWLILLAENDQAVGQVFNVGNPEEVTIGALARLIIAMTGSQAGILHLPFLEVYGPGFEESQRRVPDISKLLKTTGYSPKVPLKSALHLTWESMLLAEGVAPEGHIGSPTGY